MPRAAAITAGRRVRSAMASTPSSARGTTIMTTTAAISRRRGTYGGRPDNNITANTDLTGVIRAIKRRRRAIPTGASTRHRSASIQATSGAIGDTTERHHDEIGRHTSELQSLRHLVCRLL